MKTCRYLFVIIVSFVVTLLTGCANLTKEDITSAGVTVLNKHSEIVLVNVTPNEKFDPWDIDDKQAVQDAIVASINQAALFSQVLTKGNGDYQLDVRLLDGRQTPENPYSDTSWRDPSTPYTCFIHMNWELTRTQDHKLVYKDDITTVGHEVGVWHGIMYGLDWRSAIGRTIGTNIQLAIERMGKVKEFGELQVQSLDQSQPNPTVANTGGAQTPGPTSASNPGGSNYTLKTDPAAEAAFPEVARKYRETPVKPELPEEAHKYAVQGDFAIEKKNLPVAIDRYTDALKIAPWWPEGHLKRGQLLAEIELYDAAIADMKKFLLLAPEAKEAREAQDNIYKWESAGTLTASKGQSLTPATTGSTTGSNEETFPNNKALVYVYRLPGGAAIPLYLIANGKRLTTMIQGTYYPYIADPGAIEFTETALGPSVQCSCALNVTAGQIYYVKNTVQAGFFHGILELNQVSSEVGASEVKSCIRRKNLDQAR
jgi:tetratricopeptide (TPR) repeat protein